MTLVQEKMEIQSVALSVPKKSTPPAEGVCRVKNRDDLVEINDSRTELLIWERSLPMALRDWLDQIDDTALPYIRVFVAPEDLRPALEPLLDDCGMPKGKMRDLLINDMGDLVSAFAHITDEERVDVRLERIDHNACWKFHRDTVEIRLVTTYRGSTTEWVLPEDAERAVAEQKSFDGSFESLSDHDVAIFKGKTAGPNSGIVHRSPPIDGTGETRLLLCLNKQTVVSPAPWVRDEIISA